MSTDQSVAFAARPSGLLVPSQTIEKQSYAILHADFQKLRRLMKQAREHKLVAKFFCETCKQPVELTQEDRIIGGDSPGGRFVLSCGCSIWRIR